MGDPVTVGTVSAFGAILKGLQSIKDLAVSVEVKAKVTELYDVILAGQQSALEENIRQRSLLDTIRELEEKITSFEAWDSEKQRYALKSPWAGAAVFALKESSCNSEPPHWICTSCYQDGKKGFLNDFLAVNNLDLQCAKCKARIPTPWSGGSAERKFAEEM